MAQIPIAKRLAAYQLTEQDVQLTNLRLERDQIQNLSRQDPDLGNRLIQLKPKTLQDLKDWIGVTDAAFGDLKLPSVPAPTPKLKALGKEITPEEDAVLSASAWQFVFRHSGAIGPDVIPILDDWLQRTSPTIHFFQANDIHLSAGAQLVVAPDVFVIFAGHITIDETATILIQGFAIKIDCASFTSVSPFGSLPAFVTSPRAKQL